MIDNLVMSVPFNEADNCTVGNYFRLANDMKGEFLVIQNENSNFYFLCSKDCDIEKFCNAFDWYIVSKDSFNDRLFIGIGLADKDRLEGELYRLKDETTLQLWRDILLFTFESNFVRQFFPYTNHFKGKMRVDDTLCFYIHDYYPVCRYKEMTTESKKASNLVFRFKEGKQSALVAKLFSLAILRMPFFKELQDPVLIQIPAATRENNIQRFARFIHLLSKQLKVEDGFRSIWIDRDREPLKGMKNRDKTANLVFHPGYFRGRDVLLIDDIFTTGDSFIQVKRKLVQLGALSVTGLFFGKTVENY